MRRLLKRRNSTDPAIIRLLLDPVRLERLKGTTERARSSGAQAQASAIVERAANQLGADHASFTLLGVENSTAFSFGTEPVTTPTLATYCKFTTTGEPFQVNDAKSHPLVCSMPTTISYNIGSYLGVPITFAGYVLGALCVWNYAPREWTPEEMAVLVSLADELTEWWKT